jgi:hypothetical protein
MATCALLTGVLALTIRILLLLARLVATALLPARLLTWFLVLLTRVLVLLARILVLVGHRDLPGCLVHFGPGWRQLRNPAPVSREPAFGSGIFGQGTERKKLPLYKPLKPLAALLPHPVPTVRKWHDASFKAAGALAASLSKDGSTWIILPSN